MPKKNALVSMKNKKPRRKSKHSDIVDISDDKYPWGLRVSMDEGAIKKLPKVMNFDVDDDVILICKAEVYEKSMNEHQTRKGGDTKNRNVVFQITDLQVMPDNTDDYKAAFKEATS